MLNRRQLTEGQIGLRSKWLYLGLIYVKSSYVTLTQIMRMTITTKTTTLKKKPSKWRQLPFKLKQPDQKLAKYFCDKNTFFFAVSSEFMNIKHCYHVLNKYNFTYIFLPLYVTIIRGKLIAEDLLYLKRDIPIIIPS